MHLDANRVFWAFITVAFAALLLLGILVVKALAHDWYPIECCSGIDCAPVENATYVAAAVFDTQEHKMVAPTPRMVVTTSRGTFVLPDDLPRRVSKDNRMHVCSNNQGKVLCIFEPPTN